MLFGLTWVLLCWAFCGFCSFGVVSGVCLPGPGWVFRAALVFVFLPCSSTVATFLGTWLPEPDWETSFCS